MRQRLAELEGYRGTFSARFVRFGMRLGRVHAHHTVLLREVRDESRRVVADHVWFDLTNEFRALDLRRGDGVRFRARVAPYLKGHGRQREDPDKPLEPDWELTDPSEVEITEQSHYPEVRSDRLLGANGKARGGRRPGCGGGDPHDGAGEA